MRTLLKRLTRLENAPERHSLGVLPYLAHQLTPHERLAALADGVLVFDHHDDLVEAFV